MSKTIYFVRHGETDANEAGLISGSEHEAMLTDAGKAQAKKAGQDLKGKGIELVIASPMKRAQATARIIAEQIGYDPGKIVVKEKFTERAMGNYSGNPRTLLHEHDEKQHLENGTEPGQAFHDRIKAAIEELKVASQNVILVVGHGGTGRMVKIVSQELPHTDFHTIERLGNAEIFEFTLE